MYGSATPTEVQIVHGVDLPVQGCWGLRCPGAFAVRIPAWHARDLQATPSLWAWQLPRDFQSLAACRDAVIAAQDQAPVWEGTVFQWIRAIYPGG